MTRTVLRYRAFTDNGEGGNPAGVVLAASGLPDEEMLQMAREIGYSETAFIEPIGDGEYRVRYFSPRQEVPFCGHATVASAIALAERNGTESLIFHTRAGNVSVHTSDTCGLQATLTSVPAHAWPAEKETVHVVLTALGWRLEELDPRYPAHVAFAGANHLILAAGTRGRLSTLHYDVDALTRIMDREGWSTIHLIYAETPTLFHARDPFPVGGVIEDPATGAAAAAFGGYLRTLGLVPRPSTITIRQGEDMGIPCKLIVSIPVDGDRIHVSGTGERF